MGPTESCSAAFRRAAYYMRHRRKESSAMLEMIAATAPALGLMGTYIGLIPRPQ